jgi:hypothetical protein
MWLHCIILDIFRPFITDSKQHGFSTWNDKATSPQAIFAASVKQLKRIILTFKALDPAAGYFVSWHPALLFTVNAVLRDRNDPDRRFYFMRCIQSYRDLYTYFEIAKGVYQGLLFMGIDNKVINIAEATHMNKELHEKRRNQQHVQKMIAEHPSKYAFIMDPNTAIRDHSAALVDSMVEKFEEVTIFDEFTIVSDD